MKLNLKLILNCNINWNPRIKNEESKRKHKIYRLTIISYHNLISSDIEGEQTAKENLLRENKELMSQLRPLQKLTSFKHLSFKRLKMSRARHSNDDNSNIKRKGSLTGSTSDDEEEGGDGGSTDGDSCDEDAVNTLMKVGYENKRIVLH
jgi:hypothetical protein